MRTTVITDDGLLQRVRELTGLREMTEILHEGLRALIARETAQRLTALGGVEPAVRAPRRRRARSR